MTDLQSDVKSINSTWDAFAALKTNGSVVTWGSPQCGGDSSSVSSDLQFGVKSIIPNSMAFAALKINGKVITWGEFSSGGDSSEVSEYLQNGVIQIVARGGARGGLSDPNEFLDQFCATKADGSQIEWPY